MKKSTSANPLKRITLKRSMFTPPRSPKSSSPPPSPTDSRRASTGNLAGESGWGPSKRQRSPLGMRKRGASKKKMAGQHTRRTSTKRMARRLSQFLLTTLGRNQFKTFLTKEFSSENLLFVERANRFYEQCMCTSESDDERSMSSSSSKSRNSVRAFARDEARNAAALAVYFQFLTPNAQHEVHVNSNHREDLENALREAIPNFDEVYKWHVTTGLKRLSERPFPATDGPVDSKIFCTIRDVIWFNIEQDSFQRYLAKMAL